MSDSSKQEITGLTQRRVWNISRHELSRILLERAKAAGVELKFNTAVEELDTSSLSPVIMTDNGEAFSYDLVIAADGTLSRDAPNAN